MFLKIESASPALAGVRDAEKHIFRSLPTGSAKCKKTETGWREDVDEENVVKRIPRILPAESASEKKMRESC